MKLCKSLKLHSMKVFTCTKSFVESLNESIKPSKLKLSLTLSLALLLMIRVVPDDHLKVRLKSKSIKGTQKWISLHLEAKTTTKKAKNHVICSETPSPCAQISFSVKVVHLRLFTKTVQQNDRNVANFRNTVFRCSITDWTKIIVPSKKNFFPATKKVKAEITLRIRWKYKKD